jgi:hypothetical protein
MRKTSGGAQSVPRCLRRSCADSISAARPSGSPLFLAVWQTKQYTDFPFFVTLSKENGVYTAGRFLHAKDIGRQTNHVQIPFLLPVPAGAHCSLRYGKRTCLFIPDRRLPLEPRLSVLGIEDEIGMVRIPYFSNDGNKVLERNLSSSIMCRFHFCCPSQREPIVPCGMANAPVCSFQRTFY